MECFTALVHFISLLIILLTTVVCHHDGWWWLNRCILIVHLWHILYIQAFCSLLLYILLVGILYLYTYWGLETSTPRWRVFAMHREIEALVYFPQNISWFDDKSVCTRANKFCPYPRKTCAPQFSSDMKEEQSLGNIEALPKRKPLL